MTAAKGNLFETESILRLRGRAERAAAAGEGTFALPEAAPVAERVAEVAHSGSLRAEASRWLQDGASYHALVRLAARAVVDFGSEVAAGDAVYVPKAAGELEPMLRLWPAVIAVPTTITFDPLDLVALRAFPVHPLGIVNQATWADGRLCSPAEYFFHDLDHARFKLREDLLVEGIEIPDAYQDGSTLDARTGHHRLILPAAEGRIGSTLWSRVQPRRELVRRLLAFAARLGGPRARAAELLLFEMIYEKSLPLVGEVLDRELASDAHVLKIRRKRVSGFYGDDVPDATTMAALDDARLALKEAL